MFRFSLTLATPQFHVKINHRTTTLIKGTTLTVFDNNTSYNPLKLQEERYRRDTIVQRRWADY